jgi:multiple sugar transport system substrate-binding protein
MIRTSMAASYCAALLASALAAAPVGADTTVKVVEVITSPPRTELLQKQFAAFGAANPGIHVELISLPWGQAFEKFLNMVQAGDTPDVVEMPERWLGLYGNNDQLEDLGPYMAKWPEAGRLGERARELGSVVHGKQYEIPYGYFVRAMFWNTKLFKQAGLAAAPATIDEFVADAQKIAAIPGKYGYCLRGGAGAFGGVQMFMNTMDDKGYFNADGTSTFADPGSVQGLQTLIDIYRKGYAPKDAVSWAFNEIVAGFYSGTCAMLDQDPDALIGIADKMPAEDFAVAPMPSGPSGRAYPSLGYAGWAMFANSGVKDAAWKVMTSLLSPENNLAWAKFVGTLPIYKDAINDPYFATNKFRGWFDELSHPDVYKLTVVPSHLEGFGNFYDNIAVRTYQAALLGQRTAKDVADEWARYLTEQQQTWLSANRKN